MGDQIKNTYTWALDVAVDSGKELGDDDPCRGLNNFGPEDEELI
jgi:hypothetical protein